MKRGILFLVLFFFSLVSNSQNDLLRNKFLRLYDDNDALNFLGNASDWGYTNGTRIDVFYTPIKSRANLFNWPYQPAGKTGINTSGWGLMQTMYVPQDLSLRVPDKNDYPYSGALFAIHTIHSANPIRKINFQSEYIVGIMGPPSLAKQAQTFAHRLIQDQPPMGWDYQLPTDLLLNYNIGLEKQLFNLKDISVLGGTQLFCGSMRDGLSLHLLMQIGNNNNYFSGLSNQYFAIKKLKLSATLGATSEYVLYNALLDGGIFNKDSPFRNNHSKYGTDLQRQKIIGIIYLSVLLSTRKLGLSFTYKITSPEFKNLEPPVIGNISIYTKL